MKRGMLDPFYTCVYKSPSGWLDVVYVLSRRQLVTMPQVAAKLNSEI